MSLSDNTYYELEALKDSVRKFLKAYDYGMYKLGGWSELAHEAFKPMIDPYVEELRGLVEESQK